MKVILRVLVVLAVLLGIGLLVDLVASERWLDVLLLVLLVVLLGSSYALSRSARRTLLYE